MRMKVPVGVFCASLLLCQGMRAQAEARDFTTALLGELSNAPGPSGFEGPVRKILEREMRAAGLDVTTDGLGSLIGVLHGASERPRIMLAAHMDEVGAMVRYILPEGHVKFQLLGGWLDQALPNQRWMILTAKGPVLGVSGLRSPHIASSEDRSRVFPRDEIYLDVGTKSREQSDALGIRPGDPIIPASSFAQLAGGRWVGKALDDRVGCVLLLETLRRLKQQGVKIPNTIYFVGTVQEEVGLRGAHTAALAVKPDVGISLEAGIAADHPGVGPDAAQERLGAGPVLYLADSAMLVNLKLRDFFQRVAAENNIPLQTEVTNRGAEDSAELQRWATGTPAVNFAVPVRYLHSHNSLMEGSDLNQAVDLLLKVLPRLDAGTVQEISRF